MPRPKPKPKRIPAPKGSIYVEIPLEPEKRQYLEARRKQLSELCGCELSLFSLMAALTSKEFVDQAAESLVPKLRGLQALKQSVDDAQAKLQEESSNLGVVVEGE
jgi:hypothetical protein